jgi:hypothetical protein
VEPRGRAEEPISPELALVDPELAPRARAALPDPPWLLPVLAELQEAEKAEPVVVEERAPRRSMASSIPAATLVILLLLALAVLASSLFPSQGPSFVTEPARRAPVPAQTQAASTARATKHSNPHTPAKPLAPPAPRSHTKTVRPKPARKHEAKPRPRTLGKAQRVFRWRRYPRAAYYAFYLQRGGTTIYERRTEGLTAALPAHLRLRPGTYRVFVRPAIPVDAGIILGDAIVQKTIKV